MIETILVVDEYDTHRVGLASVLRKATGADVIAARNGRIALDEIRQQRWDIVVLDLDLPDMTGLQLIDALARAGRQRTCSRKLDTRTNSSTQGRDV